MKNIKMLTAVAALGASFVSFEAHAGMVTDAHGNVGYDTAAECDAAVQAGNAKFYQSFTHKPALKRAGEVSVRTATIKDLDPQYRLGACDLGVGRKGGRDGVSRALQGKYIPFSPDMPIHVYQDAAGNPVRVSMQQCDNWFSDNTPRPVAIPVVKEPEPVVVAPVAAAPCKCAVPYVFGSVGVLRDGLSTSDGEYDDRDNRFAGQIGVGVQFNQYLGGELYYQGAAKHKYTREDGSSHFNARNHTLATRLTVGTSFDNKARVFGKVGIAAVQHRGDGYKKTKARATAGIGASYDLTDHWTVRADYDHYFKRGSDNGVKWKGADYLGLGAQYKF
ncbi:opacity protein-like surface antigen [Neisseria perflava]|uniref:porin family protein n=1 Tax=Neisseria perflava TaxID=33053 RepID=UPI00209FD0B1|nr:porin family protein [Neisseria perflava]MCP1772335.1 opacity protein-like surface antigen [Neisseria perflava]